MFLLSKRIYKGKKIRQRITTVLGLRKRLPRVWRFHLLSTLNLKASEWPQKQFLSQLLPPFILWLFLRKEGHRNHESCSPYVGGGTPSKPATKLRSISSIFPTFSWQERVAVVRVLVMPLSGPLQLKA